MNFEEFDLDKFKKETGYEFKIAYDVFSRYYLHMFEGEDKHKHLKGVSKEDKENVTNWVVKYAIPFYESIEEFEICSRLLKVNSFILNEKNDKTKQDITRNTNNTKNK